jgi:hypothetical protein
METTQLMETQGGASKAVIALLGYGMLSPSQSSVCLRCLHPIPDPHPHGTWGERGES